MVCQREDSCSWYLTGVTSFGSGCGEAGFYGVYANVLTYEPWIRETIGTELNMCKLPLPLNRLFNYIHVVNLSTCSICGKTFYVCPK